MSRAQDSLDWLLENAGPIVRYRTAVELCKESDEKKLGQLEKDLLSSGLVQLWLSRLCPDFDKNVMHSGKSYAFENAIGKLYEFGLRKGMRVLDHKTEPFRGWLRKQIGLPNEGYFPVFYRTLVAAFLSMTGYSDDEAVHAMILRRLDTTYPFAKKADLSGVYVSQDRFPGFPKAFRQRLLINPEIYPDDEMKLPWIHDVNAFLHSASIMEDSQLRSKVETIVAFILKPQYQKLQPGYGIIRRESGRYYAMGWSVHLPGYFDPRVQREDFGGFLLLLKTLSRSQTARDHRWFSRSLSLLESYRHRDGLLRFPRNYLPEKAFGYWVSGARMGLEENRRGEKALTCESTFRHLEIIEGIQAKNRV